MAFELAPLPFAADALESGHMSADTFSFHHDKHHAAYVTNLNKLIEGTEMASKSLEEIVKESAKDPSKAGISTMQVKFGTTIFSGIPSHRAAVALRQEL